jgi:hypothetical protein
MSGYEFKEGGVVVITYVNLTVPVVNIPINGSFTGSYSISGNKVTWKTQNGRTTIDSKGLKKDHPDIYEKYKKIGDPIRVFKA